MREKTTPNTPRPWTTTRPAPDERVAVAFADPLVGLLPPELPLGLALVGVAVALLLLVVGAPVDPGRGTTTVPP